MKNGGQNFRMFGDAMHKKSSESNIDKKRMKTFFLEVHRMFLALIALKKADVVHHDLKSQNFVYNEEKNRSNIIDFGLTTTKSKIKEELRKGTYEFAIFHWSFPLELGFSNKKPFANFVKYTEIQKNTSCKLIISGTKNVMNEYEKYSKKASKIVMAVYTLLSEVHCKDSDHYCPAKHSDIFTHMLEMFKSMNKDLNYDSFIEKTVETIDVYGLGISLMRVLNSTHHLLSNDFAKDLAEIFYKMYHMNVFQRITIDDAIMLYEQCLSKHVLNSENKEFRHHKIVNKLVSKNNVEELIESVKSKDIRSVSKKQIENLVTSPKIPCVTGKEKNPFTKRCVKICKPGYERNAAFKCRSKKRTRCPNGYIRNPLTRRCVKKCPPGYKHDKDFKCVRKTKSKRSISVSSSAV